MKKFLIPILIIIIGAGILVYYFVFFKEKNIATILSSASPSITQSPSQPVVSSSPTSENKLAEPITEFKSRITKKPFGIYITKQNSPVQPERFSGYHTGADVEYEDVTTDVPVYAIADGKVVYSQYVSGYGGVFMIEIQLDGAAHTILYGHIRPSSLPKVGQAVSKGQQLAVLGTGYSSETDGERRHLHFGVLSNNRIDVKGYVQNKSELSGWIDPVSLY